MTNSLMVSPMPLGLSGHLRRACSILGNFTSTSLFVDRLHGHDSPSLLIHERVGATHGTVVTVVYACISFWKNKTKKQTKKNTEKQNNSNNKKTQALDVVSNYGWWKYIKWSSIKCVLIVWGGQALLTQLGHSLLMTSQHKKARHQYTWYWPIPC